jgi:hypothetical protein
MKTQTYFIAVLLFLIGASCNLSQAQAYKKGQKLLNANLGIGAYNVNLAGSLLSEKLKGGHSAIGFAMLQLGATFRF